MTKPSLPKSPSKLITTPEALREVCAHLAEQPSIAFDTEFIGESSYQPVLCLIQVASDERVELIDPLALKDLGCFWEILANPAIEKVCHAGDQDLQIAWQQGRRMPANIFDTQIGAGFVGTGYPVAYWRLVEQYGGVSLDKAHTFSAWDRRPLSREQFKYAVDDVRYLPMIHRALKEQIAALGHGTWMTEACAELCARVSADIEPRAVYARIKGAAGLEPLHLAVLRELAALREQLAFEHDMPPRTIFRDEVLLDIAQRNPKREADLLTVRNMPREEVVSYGDQILAAIERGRSLPLDQRPALPPPVEDNSEVKRLAEILYGAAHVICLGQRISPPLVTSQAEILRLAQLLYDQAPPEELDRHPLMHGWALACLGEPLAAFARGQRRLDITMADGFMRTQITPAS